MNEWVGVGGRRVEVDWWSVCEGFRGLWVVVVGS